MFYSLVRFPLINLTSLNGSFRLARIPKVSRDVGTVANIWRRLYTSRRFGGGVSRASELPHPHPRQTGRISFLIKSSLFTVAFGAGCYSTAVIINYERKINASNRDSIFYKKTTQIRNDINQMWNTFTGLQKTVIGIIALNVFVFLAWRIPSLQNIMAKRFVLVPNSGIYSQMTLSTFSHIQPLHIFFNMLALYTMSGLLSRIFPVEQFLAYYLSAGVFASLSSNAFKLARSSMTPSIGASGAIVACFALISLVNPKSEFYIFPIPFAVEAQNLFKILVAFDLICLLLGSRKLDHAAHLGGALYGYLFFTHGPVFLNKFQGYVLSEWKKIRSS